MSIESAHLVYTPFKRVPTGHVFIIFQLKSGNKIAISPEAEIKAGMSFSLIRGLQKRYLLRYAIQHPDYFFERYRLEGRKAQVYPLALSDRQLDDLYLKMMTRADALLNKTEWYHTLFNSCVTNVTRHIDEAQVKKRSWLSYIQLILVPIRVRNL